jgi:hypothetical protein
VSKKYTVALSHVKPSLSMVVPTLSVALAETVSSLVAAFAVVKAKDIQVSSIHKVKIMLVYLSVLFLIFVSPFKTS